MKITVLSVPDCPNVAVLDQRLERVLAGRTDVQVTHNVIANAGRAEAEGMHGSPTLLVDGIDRLAQPGHVASVSCRLYRQPDGMVDGAPSIPQLERVLNPGSSCGCSNEICDATPRSLADASFGGAINRCGTGRLAPVDGGLRATQQRILNAFAATGQPPLPVALREVVAPYGVAPEQAVGDLAVRDFIGLDSLGNIAVAYPFSASPTVHIVDIHDGPRVWAMCIVDALGIPAMLATDAVITTIDPHNKQPITVTCEEGKTAWEPAEAVVFLSCGSSDVPASVSCCGHLNAFTSIESADAWAQAHPEAEGATVDQATAQTYADTIFRPLLQS